MKKLGDICQSYQKNRQPGNIHKIRIRKEKPPDYNGKNRPQNGPDDKYMKSIHSNCGFLK